MSDDDRFLRTQAVRVTQEAYARITPRPLRAQEKVVPVVYALLVDGVDAETITQALIIARAHTEAGIDYALRQIMPPADTKTKPRYPEIRSIPFNPSEQERQAVRSLIEQTRADLRKL